MLRLLYSGAKTTNGTSNANQSFGNFPSSTEITDSIDNLFYPISRFTIQSNKTETKAIVVLNDSNTLISNLKVFFTDTSGTNSDIFDDSDCTLEIAQQALSTDQCGDVVFPYSISNASQNPLGVTFIAGAYGISNAVVIGSLPAGLMVGLWIRRRLKPEALLPIDDSILCSITDGTVVLPKSESIGLTFDWS